MKDDFKQQGRRKQLIETVKEKGVSDEKVLTGLNKIPRHLFMDSSFEDHAYQDKAFPIAAGQTISQPFTVAFQTQLLEVKPGDKILEVGTGSGYQTALLCELKAKVYSIERQLELYKKTKLFLDKIGYRPKHLAYGDGYKGIPSYAPFDKIIVTAGAPEIPKKLLAQLKINGKMVIPLGEENQIITLITRTGEKKFEQKEFGGFRFVPLLRDKV
jgi:protein-L-isoaspartate(D-aspartate) O-methyltransferase